jgi:putative ABC transport system substrate-binding protein
LKWQEGGNVRIDIRWGAGDANRIKAYAAELARLAPNVILATNTPTARALKQATATIPIVFAGLADPIGDGIVTSLARPGGNITGFTSFNADIAGKWLELLKEVAPDTKRAAVIFNPETAPHAIFLPVMQVVAPRIGVNLAAAPVSDRAAIETAIGRLAGAPDGGLVIMPDVFTNLHRELIFALAIRGKLPTACPLESYGRAGGVGGVRIELHRALSASRPICRSHSSRREAERSRRAGPDQVRADHQHQDRQGARPRHSTHAARPRRRGD